MTERVNGGSDAERDLLSDVSVDVGWRLIERFSSLVRESGMPDEHTAADYIVSELDRLGIGHAVYEPELYLSLPRSGSVAVEGNEYRAKPPAFSVSTTEAGEVTARGVYLEAPPMRDLGEIFDDRHQGSDEVVRGKVVVTNGYAMPSTVGRFEEAGAVAQVYINPGSNIHWGICTPIWGTPTGDNLRFKPRTPVVAVNRPDGEALVLTLARGSVAITVRTALDEGWYHCKLPVVTIPGETDEFLLVHGHYDSWDVGIGDNAVGDATLLELARIFHAHRGRLRRSLKIAWWPGHSTGRYAGSTWFADRFALDLRKYCVAAVNIDSPGCWQASAFEDVMWMAEADRLCRDSIADATGEEAGRRRPIRAGDYSFNQIGLTSFFMLLSGIPDEQRKDLGFYPVGGCGGNIAWHTEDDLPDVANRQYLEQDLRVYVTAIARVLNSEILPFDHRGAVDEMLDAVAEYEVAGRGMVDLSVLQDELASLRKQLDRFYAALAEPGAIDTAVGNRTITELSRILVPLNYARGARFEHDPALPLGTIPMLNDIGELGPCADSRSDRLPFLKAGIVRAVNRAANSAYEAATLIRRLM